MFSGRVQGIEYAFGVVGLDENWGFPKTGCHVQLVDPEKVFGEKHLVHCILLASKVFKEKNNVASTPELELLVRLAGTKQIKNAIRLLKPRDKAVLVVFGKDATRCYKDAMGQMGAGELDETLEKPGEKDAMERAVLLGQ